MTALDNEPAWCAPARDRIDEINDAIAYAVTADREHTADVVRESLQRQLDPFFTAASQLLLALAEQRWPVSDGVIRAADKIRLALVALGVTDIGPPPEGPA